MKLNSTTKGIFVMAGIFVATLILMRMDPFKLNPGGLDNEGIGIVWYFVPFLAFVVYQIARSVKKH